MRKEAAATLVIFFGPVLFCPADPPSPEAIHKKIAEIKRQPEPKWERIPWTASLTAARRLSEKERRPVFLFTYDGNLDIGRC